MKISLAVTNTIEKKIRNAKIFQYIESDKTEDLIEVLRQISVRSGLTIYIWSSELGLVNIKSRNTPLPATKSVLEALKYANKNHYFAVYVFPANNNKDLLEIKSTLPSSSRYLKVNSNTRFLFLINENANFNYLSSHSEKIRLVNKHTKKYKLRDSKWILSND